jgi:CRP-like cAMP-binding protein
MYVVLSGRARVVLEPSGQEVAVIERGGFFGEMSMLTGEPRTATVRAIDDVRALEIPAERLRAIALERPALVDHITGVMTARRIELDSARAMAVTAVKAPGRESLFARIQRFLRLPA